ncbi:KdsC family phosphatase [Ornithobacterium rhinotracheale]
MENYKEKMKNIKAFVFDVDGVLTDGKIMLFPDGSFVRNMNVKDGYVMQFAIKKGYLIGIITGGADPMVSQRLKALGITDIYTQSHHKYDDFEDFLFKYDLKPEEVLYMGDDVLDMEVIAAAGIGCAPNNAVVEAQKAADYISPRNGGDGCVREVIEQVMRVQGHWNDFKIGL